MECFRFARLIRVTMANKSLHWGIHTHHLMPSYYSSQRTMSERDSLVCQRRGLSRDESSIRKVSAFDALSAVVVEVEGEIFAGETDRR